MKMYHFCPSVAGIAGFPPVYGGKQKNKKAKKII
jgi:hypothetical protein